MKILQLTFTYGNNMGAMLQAYALNRVLTEMGNEVYLLPFYQEPFVLVQNKKSLKQKILYALRNYKSRNYTDEWFSKFNHFLYDKCMFAPFTDLDNLSSVENDYDLFMVGSDQVWNIPRYQCEQCLLKWVSQKEKRFSYAVSLGDYSIRLKNNDLEEALENFGAVSFREKIDYEDAKRNGLECRMDLDPTFLVDQKDWKKITDSKYDFLKNSVCVFGYDKTSFEFAKEYAKANGMKVVIVNYFGNRIFPGIKILNPGSPAELLSVIQYAGTVVTHSYHVFILSLNLNKKVYITKKSNKSGNRFDTVLDMFEIENIETKPENFNREIDWERFNNKLYSLRENSLNYLRSITKNDC